MSFNYKFTIHIVVIVAVCVTIAVVDSNLPGRLQDLPASEREVVRQLRSAGYTVSATGIS